MKKTLKQKIIERNEQLLLLNKKLTRDEKTKHFDMSIVAFKDDCRTSCCLAGFAGLQPWFRRHGFKTKFNGFINCESGFDFFGPHAYKEIFNGNLSSHFPSAMLRVRNRIKFLKKQPESYFKECK